MRNPPHGGAITRLSSFLPRLLPPGWITRMLATDVGIVIEVSDSTLGFDRGDKGRKSIRQDVPIVVDGVAAGQIAATDLLP